jgi:hypothetical protein
MAAGICDVCHIRPATTRVRVAQDGQEQVLELCQRAAKLAVGGGANSIAAGTRRARRASRRYAPLSSMADDGVRGQVVHVVAGAIGSCAVPHPLRVAVDGRTASGKTTLADEAANVLRLRGLQVIRTPRTESW